VIQQHLARRLFVAVNQQETARRAAFPNALEPDAGQPDVPCGERSNTRREHEKTTTGNSPERHFFQATTPSHGFAPAGIMSAEDA
jgi:hypothetical protein